MPSAMTPQMPNKPRWPLPRRLDLIALFAEFLGQLHAITGDWAERAEADIADWPTAAGPGLSPHTRTRLQAIVDDARRRGLLDSEEQPAASLPGAKAGSDRRDSTGNGERHSMQR
jgi:hypothetical protein